MLVTFLRRRFVTVDMDRAHALWYAFLAVWAATLLDYGAVAPWARSSA